MSVTYVEDTEFKREGMRTAPAPGMTRTLATRSIVVGADAIDPMGVEPETTIRAGTVLALDADGDGVWLPVRMTLATATASAYAGATDVTVAETTMFRVGDLVGKVTSAGGASTDLGEVVDVDGAAGTITVGALAAAVAVSDIIVVQDTAEAADSAVVLLRDVPVQNMASGATMNVGAVGASMGQANAANLVCSEAAPATGANPITARLRHLMPHVQIVGGV